MKLEDAINPKTTRLLLRSLQDENATQDKSLKYCLGIAVAALESVAADSEERFIRNVANAALKKIESK